MEKVGRLKAATRWHFSRLGGATHKEAAKDNPVQSNFNGDRQLVRVKKAGREFVSFLFSFTKKKCIVLFANYG